MTAFQGAVGVQHHRSRVTHRIRISVVENGHIVASGQETIHKIPVETRLHPQIGVRGAPGSPQKPARRIECLLERLPESDMPREYSRLALRLAIAPHRAVSNDPLVLESADRGVE